MEQSPVLGPNGKPIFQVGRIYFKQQRYKDYYVSLEWCGEGKRVEPCMAIWSATNFAAEPGVYVIGRSSLTKFVEPNGKPTLQAFKEAAMALPILGRSVLDIEIHALVDTILAFVDDVVHMRPKPPRPQEFHTAPMWEMTVRTRDGQVIKEHTV